MEKNKISFNSELLQQVEDIFCSNYDLNIDLDGKDSISNLLQQIESLKDEIINLKK